MRRLGSGPPIVLTHGFATSDEVWSAHVEALAERHTVITWDLRGHGRSAPPDRPYTREAALADLAGIVASVDGPALLAGHSVGGYLSLAHALARPETVAGLAVLSAGPGFRDGERREQYNRSVRTLAERKGFPPDVAELAVQRDSLVIDGLGCIRCPVTVIVGAADLPVYTAGSRYLAAKIEGARLVEIADAGHDVHLERPAEVTAEIAGLGARIWADGG